MEKIPYYLIITIASIIIIALNVILFGIVFVIQEKKERRKKQKPEIRSFILFLLSFLFITPITVFIVHQFGFQIQEEDKLLDYDLEKYSSEIQFLNEQINLVNEALKNLKELTLFEIENILNSSIDYSSKVQNMLSNNDSLITELKKQVITERKSAEESKRIVQSLKSITKDQMEAIKLIITEDAKKSSRISFIYGIVFSFPIGVLASWLATYAYRRWDFRISTNR